MKKSIFFFSIIFCLSSFSQTNQDSLWTIWNDNNQNDTSRLTAIYEIVKAKILYTKSDSCLLLMQQGIDLAYTSDNQKWVAQILALKGWYYNLRGEYDKAIKHYQKSHHISKHIEYEKGIGNYYNNMGSLYAEQRDYAKANEFYRKSIQYNEQTGNSENTSVAFSNLGIINIKQGNYNTAINYLNKSLIIKEQLNDDESFAFNLNALGIIYTKQGNYTKAIECYTKSLDIQLNLEDKIKAAMSMNNLAQIYSNLNDYDKAAKYYNDALKISKELDDKQGMAIVLNNLGIIQWSQKNDTQAIELYVQSLKIKEEIGDINGKANVLNNIGKVYYRLGDKNKALEYYNKSLESYNQMKLHQDRPRALNSLGQLYYEDAKYHKAVSIGNQALLEASQFGDIANVKKSADILYQSYRALSNHKKALEIYEIYTQMKDSIENKENLKTNFRLLYEYEYQKQATIDSIRHDKDKILYETKLEKERLISTNAKRLNYLSIGGVLLFLLLSISLFFGYKNNKKYSQLITQQKAEVEEKNVQIQKSLQEKELLLKEVHHRVKNNLQIISSLLNLQSKTISDKEALKALEEGKSRIKSIALIHQKLYQSSDLASLDFKSYIEQLITSIDSNYNNKSGKIDYEITIETLPLNIDTIVPLGLIINELLTNAYKYAFEGVQQGKIKVTLKKQTENTGLLTISDNGIGYPENFNPEKSKSLGLRIVRGLAKQLGGNFSYKNHNGTINGITFDIRKT